MKYTLFVQSFSKKMNNLWEKERKALQKRCLKAGPLKIIIKLAKRGERFFRKGNENKNMVAGTDRLYLRSFII